MESNKFLILIHKNQQFFSVEIYLTALFTIIPRTLEK